MLTRISAGAPYGIATGPDGALWFTLVHQGRVGRLVPGEEPAVHQLDPADGGPTVITPGADGAMWFTEFQGGRVGRITPSREATAFGETTASLKTAMPEDTSTSTDASTLGRSSAFCEVTAFEASSPYGIVAGADGAMWFTCLQTDRIGRIGAGGELTEFEVPVPGGMPSGIAAGPDDALWFTLNQGDAIGRISLSGGVTIHPLPTAGAAPVHITAGPDGALWFVEIGAGQVGRIDPTGKITEYPLPDRAARPHAIVTGPDGALWFTKWAVGRVGRITVDGAIEEFDLPDVPVTSPEPATSAGDEAAAAERASEQAPASHTVAAEPHGLTVGPDGAIWVALEAGALARIEV